MYIELGEIVGVWGVKGWVKLHSFTRDRQDITEYKTWYLSRPLANGYADVSEASSVNKVVVTECRSQGKGVVARLNGIDDRDAAESLIGDRILVKKADLPVLDEGEYYWHQLIGLTAFNSSGDLGQVASIIETGANDVLVVQLEPKLSEQVGEQECLIPYTPEAVVAVDLERNRLEVDWELDYL